MVAWGRQRELTVDKAPADRRHLSRPIYTTDLGALYSGDSKKVLRNQRFVEKIGKAQMVFTSPPFPLNTKKRYGNLQGEEYIRWFASYAPILRDLVTDDGSIVVEIGNAWEAGRPIMSTVVLRALLRFLEKGGLQLCQEFIWYNPARLPSPIQWVNIERIRVKDAFTRVWWMSPVDRPKADNRRVLRAYSGSMKKLLETGEYNAGRRPSEHLIGETSFAKDNRGAIPPNVGDADEVPALGSLLKAGNTGSSEQYQMFCREQGISAHPARMPPKLAEFFIQFLTDEGDLVVDPFAGSNTTGSVAQSLNRRWASIEMNWDYALASIARFNPDDIASVGPGLRLTDIDPSVDADPGEAFGLSSQAPL